MKTQETILFEDAKEFKKYLRNVNIMPEAFNRAVKNSHCTKMKESLSQIRVQRAVNVIRTSAFGKKDSLYIADGQHLRKAILTTPDKNLGKHLAVFVNHLEEVEEIIPFVSRMNATAKNWNQKNYLDAWTTQGVKEYVFLSEKFKKSNYTLSVILETYILNKRGGDSYKNGTVKLDINRGNRILRAYENACAVGLNRNTSSALATAKFFKTGAQIPEEKFVNMVAKNSTTFKHKLNRDGYLGLFRTFYNKTK